MHPEDKEKLQDDVRTFQAEVKAAWEKLTKSRANQYLFGPGAEQGSVEFELDASRLSLDTACEELLNKYDDDLEEWRDEQAADERAEHDRQTRH